MTEKDFDVICTDGAARATRICLRHGVVETPAFMPVGTSGVVKTLSPGEIKFSGTQILLGNTYHLYLRPGMEILKKFGGLHSFMGWDGPILTDSGGFQVFSLGNLKAVTDDGVLFQSHLDGSSVFLTPELSAEIQKTIQSDIAMVLDECIALPNSTQTIKDAVRRSFLWAKRFLSVPHNGSQKIFGIIQGGCHHELRRESLERTLELDLDGIAVGGLSVGEPRSDMADVLEFLSDKLPRNHPRYLMGVGTPRDLLEGVRWGMDIFDCVLPTRNARNGGFFTEKGLLNIRNEKYRLDERPIEKCMCEACQKYSRAYLRHLFQMNEILGHRLATTHNLTFFHSFMARIRKAILEKRFDSFYQENRTELLEAYPAA